MSSANVYPDRLLWIDIETSDSDEKAPHAALLEIGLTITSFSGQTWNNSSQNFLVEPNDRQRELLYRWPREVMEMHTKNGLLFEWLNYSAGEDDYILYIEMLKWINDHIEGPPLSVDKRIVAAGSGLHFDRRWLSKFVPQMDRHLTYYNIDVGVMRRMIQMHAPSLLTISTVTKEHRALSCNAEAIDTYRWIVGILHKMEESQR